VFDREREKNQFGTDTSHRVERAASAVRRALRTVRDERMGLAWARRSAVGISRRSMVVGYVNSATESFYRLRFAP